MLVLTRKEDESLVIFPSEYIDPSLTVAELFSSGPIKITINKISGLTQRHVQIGIDAPRDLVIVRGELEQEIAVA
jgi:sRNA-binding carbon storage regulator CsrA